MDWRKIKENPSYWQILSQRAEIVNRMRQFFYQQGFLEVSTPVLSPALIPESYLEVFETVVKDKQGRRKKAYLTPSPELWLKKLLVAGGKKIFEITKAFRNTDLGGHFHNPEFTLLEWYRRGADYHQTMADCEALIRFLVPQGKLSYQGEEIDLTQPFEKISLAEAFSRWAGIEPETLFDGEKLKKEAQKRGYSLTEDDDWETVYQLIYLKEVEPNLGRKRGTIIYHFPACFAPLAEADKKNPQVKKRFELYLFGVELADGYQELTDPEKQKEEFEKELKKRKELKKTPHPPDEDFLEALEVGLPFSSGVALGVDRLVMILTNKRDIKEVVLFAGEEIFF